MSNPKRVVKSPRTAKPKVLKKTKTSTQATSSPQPIKVYVLDTNVLISDPQSIFKFHENTVCIPVEVLEELDNFKTEQSERGAAARKVHRLLDELFENNATKMKDGATNSEGGRILVVINPQNEENKAGIRIRESLRDLRKMDHLILWSALHIQETMPPPVILVSKDINMRLKALRLGLDAQDYLNDKKDITEIQGHEAIEVTDSELQLFYSSGEITLADTNVPASTYVSLNNVSDPTKAAPAKSVGNGVFRRLAIGDGLSIKGGIYLKPRSFEQRFLMDAIMDPKISLITVQGKAGTGKTIVTVGTALHLLQAPESQYQGLSISRPIVAMGKDIGALPGDLNEKLRPWLQPYHDALQVLMPARNVSMHPSQVAEPGTRKERKQNRTGSLEGAAGQPYENLMKAGMLEIEALQYIRGRSIPRRIFVVDEAQNLTKHEVKTIITRMSEGSKIILMGDPDQIDNAFVDALSNGLVYTANKLAREECTAHVKLIKGERSKLAEIGAKLL